MRERPAKFWVVKWRHKGTEGCRRMDNEISLQSIVQTGGCGRSLKIAREG